MGIGLKICNALFAYNNINALMLHYMLIYLSLVIHKRGFDVIITAYVWINIY